MERSIVSFKLDLMQEWTAILSCGHPQHTRHKPPFETRPWVTTEDGRNSMIGTKLNCVRCDEFEIPADFMLDSTTPEFTEENIPAPMLKDHVTKSGIWGKLIVLRGSLKYFVDSWKIENILDQNNVGIIVPELPHRVAPMGDVKFLIEFYKAKQ